jgi:thiol-disulfide isomerase/thioredoxin
MKKIHLLVFFVLLSTCIIGQDAFPNINLKTLDGKATTSQNIIQEHPLIVMTFWASWCKPCHQELNTIADLYDDWKNTTGVEIIAVSTDDSRASSKVKSIVSGNDWPFKVFLDENGDLKRALSITNIPFLLIIKDGKIIHKHVGYTPGSEAKVYEILKNNSK